MEAAVGFLPGNRDGDRWDVTIHNLHAWPELYLDGLGWVAFEPTPAIAEPPGYAGGTPQAEPSVTPTPTQSADDDEGSEFRDFHGSSFKSERVRRMRAAESQI